MVASKNYNALATYRAELHMPKFLLSARQKGRQVGKDYFDLNISETHALSLNTTGPAAPKQLSYCPKLLKLMAYICCANCNERPSGTANLLEI